MCILQYSILVILHTHTSPSLLPHPNRHTHALTDMILPFFLHLDTHITYRCSFFPFMQSTPGWYHVTTLIAYTSYCRSSPCSEILHKLPTTHTHTHTQHTHTTHTHTHTHTHTQYTHTHTHTHTIHTCMHTHKQHY